MKRASHAPDVPKDQMDSATLEQGDWPLEQVKQLALELYARFPFDDEDTERWNDLARQAFLVLDNLDEACKEVLKERSKDRRRAARVNDAYQKLSASVTFDEAARYITGEKRTDRARSKFNKFLEYDARFVPFEGVSPKLSAEQKRQLKAQLKKKRIPRHEVVRLRWLFEGKWLLIKAEQSQANRAKRTDKRRGARTQS